MIRRETFESVGLFDENFFLFFEEHDLLRRIKKHGWKIYYLPDAEIQHLFEESVRNSSIDIGSIYMKSALYYYRRHYGVPGLIFIRLLMIFNNFILSHARNRIKETDIFKKVYPSNKTLFINWPSVNKAERYLVEISYSPSFCDRGGMFISGNSLSLESRILDRLPFRTGLLRILPVYRNNSTGKVIQVIKITDRQNEKVNHQ
jgi:GT2 family glycosyltransferase